MSPAVSLLSKLQSNSLPAAAWENLSVDVFHLILGHTRQGWRRDLTAECVEPNTGPGHSWHEIRKRFEERKLSVDEVNIWKSVLDSFKAALAKENPLLLGFNETHVQELIQKETVMNHVFGPSADVAKGYFEDILASFGVGSVPISVADPFGNTCLAVAELPIDYYQKLPNYTGRGYNVPYLEGGGWSNIHHSQYNEVVARVRRSPLLALSGRRRIGKSYMMYQIAHEEYSGTTPVFYVSVPPEVNGNVVPFFYSRVLEELEVFDNAIPKPTPGRKSASLCIELIGWLLRSGVIVILDEFQNLNSLSFRFRELIDRQHHLFTGRLVCIGSQPTALSQMIRGGNEPLYGRGFEYLVINPTSASTVCKLLCQVTVGDTKLTNRQLVFLYSFFGGLLQWYERAFRTAQLFSIAADMDKLVDYLEKCFEGDPFYAQQLFSTESTLLQLAYIQMTSRTNFGEMPSNILHDAQLDTTDHRLLGNLVEYQFLGIRNSLSTDVDPKHETQHPQYYLRDALLAMRAVLQASGRLPKDMSLRDLLAEENTPRSYAVTTAVGKCFKEMVRDIIQASSSDKWEILRGDWREQFSEIDFVAISKEKRSVIWGTDKLSASKQDPHKHLCHIVSYFNNRLWQNDDYFSYQHILVFIYVQENDKNRFANLPASLNALLKKGRSKELEDLCKQKLSNREGGGNSFMWYEGKKEDTQDNKDENQKKNIPPIIAPLPPSTPKANRQPAPIQKEAHFRIYACHAIDMDDLLEGVQLDDFVPTV